MESFVMAVAGAVTRVEPLFESTREYCRAYLSDQTPDLTVAVTKADLAFEQEMLDREAVEEGLKLRKFTEPFLERAAIQRRVAEWLLARDTLMLHGSTVCVDGKAYLFTAPCGTGKSTHTRLWREKFGQRAVMVNDDKPFLQLSENGVLAYGSPWSGKHGLATNICVPLKGICLLHRGTENTIEPIDADRLAEFLLHQAHQPTDPALMQKTCVLVDRIAKTVPLWEMYCNKEPEAAEVAYRAMSK